MKDQTAHTQDQNRRDRSSTGASSRAEEPLPLWQRILGKSVFVFILALAALGAWLTVFGIIQKFWG